MKVLAKILAFVWLAALSGCLTMGSVQRAETLGKGNFEFGVEPGAWVGVVTNQNLGNSNLYLPAINFSARFGVSDRVDLGARIGTTLLEGMAKIQLTDPASQFVISLAPSVEGFGFAAGSGANAAGIGLMNIGLPVLIGLKFGDHELTFGPRINNLLIFGAAGSGSSGASAVGYSFMPGLSAGFAARITDFFELMPEISFGFPVATAGGGTSGGSTSAAGAVTAGNAVILNFTLGIKFGRLKKANPEPAPTPPPMPPPAGPDPVVPPPPPPPPPA